MLVPLQETKPLQSTFRLGFSLSASNQLKTLLLWILSHMQYFVGKRGEELWPWQWAEVFLSCITLSVYKVICVTCQLRSWFVQKTGNANERVNAKSHSRDPSVCRVVRSKRQNCLISTQLPSYNNVLKINYILAVYFRAVTFLNNGLLTWYIFMFNHSLL